MNLNKVILIGRATKIPELRRTPSGVAVSAFSIATSRTWVDKSKGKQEETEFHNVVAWGRTAEVASQFVGKGHLLMIEGRLKTRAWEDKQGGKHRATEVIVESLQLGPKPNTAARSAEPKVENNKTVFERSQNEEIPIINLDEGPAQDAGSEEIPF